LQAVVKAGAWIKVEFAGKVHTHPESPRCRQVNDGSNEAITSRKMNFFATLELLHAKSGRFALRHCARAARNDGIGLSRHWCRAG
jgi:hypothetical protein